MNGEKILVVDDESHIVELIKYNLQGAGYKVLEANDGLMAIDIIKEEKPALVLLDLMIPKMDGFEVCKKIRADKETKGTAVIMLTAKGDELDKILGLELGADDYITKPFSVRELLARVKAVLRRSQVDEEEVEVHEFGELKIDFERRQVKISNQRIDLTLKEFELLEVLVKNKGKILTRDKLLDKIWGYEFYGESRTVDVHIRYLRKKIELDDKDPRYIETIRGVGYRFNPES